MKERKNARLFYNDEDGDLEDRDKTSMAHVDLENFGSIGILYNQKSPLRKSSLQHYTEDKQDNTATDRDDILTGVRIRWVLIADIYLTYVQL